MKNITIRTEKTNKSKTSQMLREWRLRGYADRMAGRGFDPEYDRVGPNRQLNYEQGRLLAAAKQAA